MARREDARGNGALSDTLRPRPRVVGHASTSGLAPAYSRREPSDPRRPRSGRIVLGAGVDTPTASAQETFPHARTP